MSLRFGFDHFAILQLGNEGSACMLSNRLALHDLPAGLAEEYDKRHRFGDSVAYKSLTPRETEILRWISHGKTASEIALIVSVSEHTVNSHTATILKKLDVVNRTQMVAKAIREQIIQ
jgi:DNA-binding CsgD family transcriptional regulator